jgi:hypothetical protein
MSFQLDEQRVTDLGVETGGESFLHALRTYCDDACAHAGIQGRSTRNVRTYIGALITRSSVQRTSDLREGMAAMAEHLGDDEVPKEPNSYLRTAGWTPADLVQGGAAQVMHEVGTGAGLLVDDLIFDRAATRLPNRKTKVLRGYGMHIGKSDRADEPTDTSTRRAQRACVRQRAMFVGYLGDAGGAVLRVSPTQPLQGANSTVNPADALSGDEGAARLMEELFADPLLTATGNLAPVRSAIFDEAGWPHLRGVLALAGVDYALALVTNAGVKFLRRGSHQAEDAWKIAGRLTGDLRDHPLAGFAYVPVNGIIGAGTPASEVLALESRPLSPGHRPMLWVLGMSAEEISAKRVGQLIGDARQAAATLDRELLEKLHAEAWPQTNADSWTRHLALVSAAHGFVTKLRAAASATAS